MYLVENLITTCSEKNCDYCCIQEFYGTFVDVNFFGLNVVTTKIKSLDQVINFNIYTLLILNNLQNSTKKYLLSL